MGVFSSLFRLFTVKSASGRKVTAAQEDYYLAAKNLADFIDTYPGNTPEERIAAFQKSLTLPDRSGIDPSWYLPVGMDPDSYEGRKRIMKLREEGCGTKFPPPLPHPSKNRQFPPVPPGYDRSRIPEQYANCTVSIYKPPKDNL